MEDEAFLNQGATYQLLAHDNQTGWLISEIKITQWGVGRDKATTIF